METAPTSIEVLLRPALGQSDEPSDLRGSLSPTSVYSTWQSPGGHPSNYYPGATSLNFSDRANHDERTPYSVFNFSMATIYDERLYFGWDWESTHWQIQWMTLPTAGEACRAIKKGDTPRDEEDCAKIGFSLHNTM